MTLLPILAGVLKTFNLIMSICIANTIYYLVLYPVTTKPSERSWTPSQYEKLTKVASGAAERKCDDTMITPSQ